jgi:hypothetical protein
MVAAALAGVVLFIAAGLIWSARLLHVGHLDAQALAEKVAVPNPVSALDWPELHVRAVVPQPDEPPLVLLVVGWPAHPRRASTLLVALDSGDDRSLSLLSRWCSTQASISPTRRGGADGASPPPEPGACARAPGGGGHRALRTRLGPAR